MVRTQPPAPAQSNALRVAIYARYSTDMQKATSLDDQIARCEQYAQQHGFEISSDLIFTDAAMSGTSKSTAKRVAFNDMLAKLKAGDIDVLVVDEMSRLSRDVVDQAHLIRFLEENPKIRVITADGLDTSSPQWQLHFGMTGLIAQDEVRKIRHRVERGMRGALERGFMCGYPPLGYRIEDVRDERGTHHGTKWVIFEEHAAIVREVFQLRGQGQSMHEIAKLLNAKNAPSNSGTRYAESQFWRPARVKILLANAIYKGEFWYRGSANYAAKQKKLGLTAEVEVFLRPELRLVSDELWERCNANKISRSAYGGGKNALAGLIECGVCGSTLAISTGRSKSAYCASCTADKAITDNKNTNTSTVVVSGIKEMLLEILDDFLTQETIALFRARLQEKLSGTFTQELNELEKQTAYWSKVRDRLSNILGTEEDEVLILRYAEAKKRHQELERQLTKLKQKSKRVDREAIRIQLEQCDPLQALKKLLIDEKAAPERVRSVLRRLFPSIVFDGKTDTHCSHFTVTVAIGAALGIASDTDEVVEMNEVRKYTLQFSPRYRSGAERKWRVIRCEDINEQVKDQQSTATEEEMRLCELA